MVLTPVVVQPGIVAVELNSVQVGGDTWLGGPALPWVTVEVVVKAPVWFVTAMCIEEQLIGTLRPAMRARGWVGSSLHS
jgi:hypothetical protein